MARRMIAVLLALCCLTFWGCGAETEEAGMKHPAKFYYKVRLSDGSQEAADKAVDYELRETEGHEMDYRWLLEAYFQGPSREDLTTPFPKSTTLRAAALDGGTMYVDVSRELAELTGMDLTIACSCILLTCLELDGVRNVSISADGESLDGRQMITLDQSSLMLEDQGGYDPVPTYLLYFSDTDNRYLISEVTRLEANGEKPQLQLIKRLIEGPTEAGLAQTVPLETEVLNLEIDGGMCSLNLSRAFLDNAPKTELAQRMTLLSITNTLTRLEQIDSVVLYVEGQRLDTYGAMDLRKPLTFEAGAVGPARTSLNERDADLYLYIGDNTRLSKVPVRVRQSADKLACEQVLEQLLAYPGQNGYSSRIPAGTTIRSVTVERNTCLVVLSKEMAKAEGEQLGQAIRSVWATALAVGNYGAVRVTIEDYTPPADQENLFAETVWDDLWLSEVRQK